jgi:hypothetical protein
MMKHTERHGEKNSVYLPGNVLCTLPVLRGFSSLFTSSTYLTLRLKNEDNPFDK